MKLDTSVEFFKVLEVLMKLDGMKPWGDSCSGKCWYGYQMERSGPKNYSMGRTFPCEGRLTAYISEKDKKYVVVCEKHFMTLRKWEKVEF